MYLISSPSALERLDLCIPGAHPQLLQRLLDPNRLVFRSMIHVRLDLLPTFAERIGQLVRRGDDQDLRATVGEE